ncbi:hypothetical protein CHUAL_002179 [Chamberlinius hualienensis]
MSIDYHLPWGEPSEGFLKYLKTLTKLPSFPSNNPEVSRHFLTPEGTVYHTKLLRGVYESANILAKPDDIYVVSFPKTGTTWAQELVYIIASNCDFKSASSISLQQRFSFIEMHGIQQHISSQPGPRFIKTHLSYTNLPKSVHKVQPKIVYITRNPKDTCVSMYHFYKALTDVQYSGTFEQFVDMFINGQVNYSPFGRNVLEMWERRHQPNILFITYEQLQKDYKNTIRAIGRFFGKSLTEYEVNQVADYCCFTQMSSNPQMKFEESDFYVNTGFRFMRKGQTGDWKNHFDDKTNQKMDEWIERTFKDTGIHFQYELC